MTTHAEQTGPLDIDRLKTDVRRAVGGVELYSYLHPEPAGDLRDGGTVRCIAPDHPDRDPSMTIHADGGFKCHACGASGGDVFDLYAIAHDRRCKGDEFTRILRELADFAGLNPASYRREDGETGDVSDVTAQRPEPTPKPRKRPADRGTDTPSETRRRIMGAIWEVVDDISFTDTARQWLDSRSIAPHAAHGYGCRDWYWGMTELRRRLDWFDTDELRAAGLANADGDVWWPIRAAPTPGYCDETTHTDAARGLFVPVWHPDHPEWPMAWRWRAYWPGGPDGAGDFPPKSMAPPSGTDGLNVPPLGLCERSPRAEVMRGARWLNRDLDTDTARQCLEDTSMRPLGAYPGEYVVVLCEGETDWLSVATAADRLESGRRIVPVGVTSMSAEWREDWTDYIAGASGYVAMFDHAPADDGERSAGQQRAAEIAAQLIARHPDGRRGLEGRWRMDLFDEQHDANDRLNAGELADRLSTNLAELDR